MDTLAMLEELLEQDQFELLIPKDGMSGELRLVYLMNDAVESFLDIQKRTNDRSLSGRL